MQFRWEWNLPNSLVILELGVAHPCLKWLLPLKKLPARSYHIIFHLPLLAHMNHPLHSTWFLNFPENSIKNVSQKTRGCYCCICIYGQGWERTWLEVRTHHRFLYFYLLLSISWSLSFFISGDIINLLTNSCTTKLKISFIIVWFTLHNYDKPAYELVIKRMRSIKQTV